MTALIEEPAVIRLSNGMTALVDAADADRIGAVVWSCLRGHNGKCYAHRRAGRSSVYMHRLIAGTPDGFETDHINGNGLDNRRANLRTATASQNRANMGKPRRPDGAPHSSRFKGVSWDRSRGKWQAKINVNGRHHNLGRYFDETAAARAYDAAAITAWGDFARLNFTREVAA